MRSRAEEGVNGDSVTKKGTDAIKTRQDRGRVPDRQDNSDCIFHPPSSEIHRPLASAMSYLSVRGRRTNLGGATDSRREAMVAGDQPWPLGPSGRQQEHSAPSLRITCRSAPRALSERRTRDNGERRDRRRHAALPFALIPYCSGPRVPGNALAALRKHLVKRNCGEPAIVGPAQLPVIPGKTRRRTPRVRPPTASSAMLRGPQGTRRCSRSAPRRTAAQRCRCALAAPATAARSARQR